MQPCHEAFDNQFLAAWMAGTLAGACNGVALNPASAIKCVACFRACLCGACLLACLLACSLACLLPRLRACLLGLLAWGLRLLCGSIKCVARLLASVGLALACCVGLVFIPFYCLCDGRVEGRAARSSSLPLTQNHPPPTHTKKRYQTWGQDNASFWRTARLMWRDGRIRPFLKGTSPTILRDLTFGGVYSLLRNGLLRALREVQGENAPRAPPLAAGAGGRKGGGKGGVAAPVGMESFLLNVAAAGIATTVRVCFVLGGWVGKGGGGGGVLVDL